jgi:hypothetical protein
VALINTENPVLDDPALAMLIDVFSNAVITPSSTFIASMSGAVRPEDRRNPVPRQEGISHSDPVPGFGNPPRLNSRESISQVAR